MAIWLTFIKCSMSSACVVSVALGSTLGEACSQSWKSDMCSTIFFIHFCRRGVPSSEGLSRAVQLNASDSLRVKFQFALSAAQCDLAT